MLLPSGVLTFNDVAPVTQLIVSIIVIPPSLRYLERLWGARETFKFLLWPLLASNVVAFGFNWIEFIATKNVMFLSVASKNFNDPWKLLILVQEYGISWTDGDTDRSSCCFHTAYS
jgi:hypothetical protein